MSVHLSSACLKNTKVTEARRHPASAALLHSRTAELLHHVQLFSPSPLHTTKLILTVLLRHSAILVFGKEAHITVASKTASSAHAAMTRNSYAKYNGRVTSLRDPV
jgi:hypothetical protein